MTVFGPKYQKSSLIILLLEERSHTNYSQKKRHKKDRAGEFKKMNEREEAYEI